MHGVKKGPPPSDEKIKERQKKAATYRKLCDHALRAKAAGKNDAATFQVVEKLLGANPDVATLWNYRREMLLAKGDELDPAPELTLTAACLRKQPKSYPAWHHRLWVVRRRPEVARGELELCAMFLKEDERNFHCWNYRRVVSALAGETPEEARAFARGRLDANFSNYSAYHALAAGLPEHLDEAAARPELDLARQALFCEPDDQSSWWYHQDVLRRAGYAPALVDAEISALEELRALEPGARWPIVFLLRLRARRGLDVADLHAELRRVDPAHAGMYGEGVPDGFSERWGD